MERKLTTNSQPAELYVCYSNICVFSASHSGIFTQMQSTPSHADRQLLFLHTFHTLTYVQHVMQASRENVAHKGRR